MPLFIWLSPHPNPAAVATLQRRPYQTDVLDRTVLSLAHVQTRFDRPQLDLLGKRYVAQTRFIGSAPYKPSPFRHD